MDRLRRAADATTAASTWPAYDLGDAALHRAIAASAGNATLLYLHDRLARLGRTVAWGRLRERGLPSPTGHTSHREHDAIVAAIAARDRHEAVDRLRHHLQVEAAALLG